MKLPKFNSLGFSHILVPILLVVGVGSVGTYALVKSHASTACVSGVSWLNGKAQSYAPGNFCLQQGARQLIFQTDGNLVLYNIASGGAKTALWSSGTYHTGTSFNFQANGSLVVKGKTPGGTGTSIYWTSVNAPGVKPCYQFGFQYVSGKYIVQEAICSPYKVVFTVPHQ